MYPLVVDHAGERERVGMFHGPDIAVAHGFRGQGLNDVDKLWVDGDLFAGYPGVVPTNDQRVE